MLASTLRRHRHGRRGRRAMVFASALVMAGCSGGHHQAGGPSTAATSTSLAMATTVPSTDANAAIGLSAFNAYQHAFSVIAEIAGSQTGVSTDPRLAQVLTNPWYLQVVQEINLYRLRGEVVRGDYSFSNFHLDAVTADGRVIFTDCQTNSQAIYDAKTGALVGNPGTSRIAEQVVAYRTSPGAPFKIADDNQGTQGASGACVS